MLSEFFHLGMDREIIEPIPPRLWGVATNVDDPLILNVGAGKKIIPGTVLLDLPEWNADEDKLPFDEETVSGIHAYHFLEHVENVPRVLAEFQRVLKPGGFVNICVPYYTSQMQAHDLGHKHVFCEETWRNLFNCPYYERFAFIVEWKFSVRTNVIIGIVERNLALLTQLMKIFD